MNAYTKVHNGCIRYQTLLLLSRFSGKGVIAYVAFVIIYVVGGGGGYKSNLLLSTSVRTGTKTPNPPAQNVFYFPLRL